MDSAADNLELAIKDVSDTTSAVQIHVNPSFFSDVSERLEPYKNLPAAFGPALEKVGDYLRVTMVPRIFAEEGPGWAPLAKFTQRQRAQQGYAPAHPILQRSKDLYKELTEKSHPNHIEVITTGKNARITFGGSSAKFLQNQLGKGDPGQNLPARPMIPGTGGKRISPSDKEQIRKILVTAIKEQISK